MIPRQSCYHQQDVLLQLRESSSTHYSMIVIIDGTIYLALRYIYTSIHIKVHTHTHYIHLTSCQRRK